uniref:Keratin, type I cytoskeletal 9-like n=2 Tax=Nicotiana TaxID=4085 RepID=A0A1S4ANN5_TOBAC|nr:PREDICTED: keratin, type I cytoskeletal 9-like [Nicotiana sylvestris]XP_016478296.1 PREDICTED: keratin, type I cytoskeletal 9-like [Nicotiana tabacum]
MDVFTSILPILLIFIFVGVLIFIKELCTNSRAKEIRGTPSIVASSSVHVNVYGGGQTAAKEAPRTGGGAAKGGGSRGGSKVVNDGSKVGAKDVTIVIDSTRGKVDTTVYSSNGTDNICDHQKEYLVGVTVSGGVPGGVHANGGGGGGNDGVVKGGVGGRSDTLNKKSFCCSFISVLVNVYGGGQTAAANEAAQGGGGAAKGGGSGDGSKVVSDGSKLGAKVVTISIDGITGKVNTITTVAATILYSSNNGYANKCGICKKAILLEPAAVNGGVRANGGGNGATKGDGCEDGSKVVLDGSKVGAKVVTIVIDCTNSKVINTTIAAATTLYSLNNGSADKCGICKKAILLEPASMDSGVRANGDGGGNDDGVGSGATGGVGGGGSHAK